MKLPHPVSHAFALNFLPISSTILFSLLPLHPLQAQIVPDNTLPVNSLIAPNGSTFIIDGGTSRGSNLFHSFVQFSLPTGGTALFNNTLDIQNIFTRVTGSSVSNIDGIIQANGTANLFFINPKGIIFGANAALNIGGSFLASTAGSINFADGSHFSATSPQSSPILTVTVPVGLGFGSNPGAIQVQGTGHSLTIQNLAFPLINRGNNLSGLRVQPGKTLALVGGDIAIAGGILSAESGQIELGSVGAGQVNLSPTPQGFRLGYENVQNFQDIHFSQQALTDASGNGSSYIHLQGARVSLTDGSQILIQNQGSQPGGSIVVNASESVNLIGIHPGDTQIASGLNTQTLGIGTGADIEISTQQLLLQEGGEIHTRSFGPANAGNININASESVQLNSSSPLNSNFDSSITTTTNSFQPGGGDTGYFTLSTKRLTILNGGTMGVVSLGTGSGKDVVVNAESIELTGVAPGSLTPSILGASTLLTGNVGNVTVNTNRLVLRNGGRVDATTFNSGNAGSVTINASDSVEVSGTVPGSVNPSLISATANILDESIRKFFGLPDRPSGNSGNVTINTPYLSVTDGAQVTVKNDGTGSAGILTINTDSMFLDNQGGITAVSGAIGERENEANITLNVRNSLQMRHNSVISADARGQQRGGNIIINAGAIAAVPEENSDITASAPQGTGGRITINTQGIFGTQVRPNLTPESDITAFGDPTKAQSNGIVQVNTPEINVQAALNQLNGNFITTEQAIASSCFARRNVEQGTFTVTGTGGLPTTPYDAIGGRYAVTQVQGLPNSARQQTSSPTPNPPSPPAQSWKLGDPIQEAQGMSITPDGRIIVGTNPQLAAIADPQTLICHLTVRPKAEGRGQKG